MKTTTRMPLPAALREAASLPAPRPAAEFWQDFRIRAAQAGTAPVAADPAPEVTIPPGFRAWRWAAAMVLLISLAATLRLARPPVARAALEPAAVSSDLSKVEEVEVFSEYSSVMIMEDLENGGTVIWVASATP